MKNQEPKKRKAIKTIFLKIWNRRREFKQKNLKDKDKPMKLKPRGLERT